MDFWPNQVYALEELPRRILAGERRICLTSPTGGGKGQIICGMIEWALAHDWYSVLYTNRKLLIEQLSGVLEKHGIQFGVRASEHEDQRHRPVQISSLPTERTRVLNTKKWEVHGHGRKVLALVDEAHLNKADTAKQILDLHLEHGGAYVGFTATPIDLGHLYDSLVVAGTPSELRRCGALVPAYHYGPDEPDMQRFKQNIKTGEYTEGDVRKAIMTKCVFARVLDWYGKLNPEQRPTILFAPGVGESIWFTEQFVKEGIPWAHIDGQNVWLDGELKPTSQDLRKEIIDRLKDGSIKGVSNRFVLREGIDIPEASHAILATVMGSLQTYLQSVGRVLRAFLGKTKATVQDHGGHWHRHGSANMDRNWNLSYTEAVIAGTRQEKLQQKAEPEPIHCPQCGLIRKGGDACPTCGYVSKKRSRMVVQLDGTLREHVGDIYKPRQVREQPETLKHWKTSYYQAKNSKNGMTFRQAEALFFRDHGYWPSRNLPLMPVDALDFFKPVRDVPYERLYQFGEAE